VEQQAIGPSQHHLLIEGNEVEALANVPVRSRAAGVLATMLEIACLPLEPADLPDIPAWFRCSSAATGCDNHTTSEPAGTGSFLLRPALF
jgi:hypothetical protein